MKHGASHHSGSSLHPVRKFKAGQHPRGRVPMRKPRRTKHFYGRGGGIRGKGSKRR